MPFLALLILLSVISIVGAPVKIACVGDSITEGANVGQLETYPARLQRLLGATNNFLVQNFGVSARTLLKRGDFPYWNDNAFTLSRAANPDIVIIQLGTNDSKPYNWVYGTNFVSDYKEMVAIYAALPSAPKIYLCAPCPVYGNGNFEINPGTIRTNIAPAVRTIAQELGLPLIDLQARMTNLVWFPDNVHPDSSGLAAMAAIMFDNLAGGLPNEEPPPLQMQRVNSTRVILSWPAKWGGLVPRTTPQLPGSVRPAWTILQTAIPWSDGVTIRQTNNFIAATQRYFQLARP